MEELDLSGVDPLKWAEVRRRVAAVRSYLDLKSPTPDDRERHAALIGIGAQQFNTLAKAWTLHRDANSLSPGIKRRRAKSKCKDGGVHPDARRIAAETIALKGTETTLSEMFDAVVERCEDLGVPAPGRTTVWILMREAGEAAKTGGEPRILVAAAFLRLPVKTDAGILFPEVTMAVSLPDRRVLAAVLDADGNADGLDQIARIVGDAQAASGCAIEVAEGLGGRISPSLIAGTRVTELSPQNAARALSGAIGRQIGLIGLCYKTPTTRPGAVMQSGRDEAPSVADAAMALRFAVEAHNAAIAADI